MITLLKSDLVNPGTKNYPDFPGRLRGLISTSIGVKKMISPTQADNILRSKRDNINSLPAGVPNQANYTGK